jgi:predicted phage replisome organizer
MKSKFYWLKLDKDFFKRHDIKIIEAMPNGKDYILFYLKLLCESIDHNGSLRFSENIPYNEEMLSIITNKRIVNYKNEPLAIIKVRGKRK